MSYFDSGGNKTEFANIEYKPSYETIYGIDNVVDIVAIGNNGDFYSIDLKSFKDVISVKNTGDSSPVGYKPKQALDNSEALTTLILDHDIMLKNVSNVIVANTAGAWLSTGANDMLSLNGAAKCDIDSMELDTAFNKFNDVTEFFYLYNRMSAIDIAIKNGYELFDKVNFNHRNNWIAYKTKSGWNEYARYLLVLYITKPKALLQNSFLQSPNEKIAKLTTDTGYNVSLLRTELCTSPISSISNMRNGSYYMGDSIYSQSTKYRFVIQADGDCVVYDYNGNIIWMSNTRTKTFIRCVLTIDKIGNMILDSTNSDSNKRFYNENINQPTYLSLTDSGILVLRNESSNELLWTSSTDGKLNPNTDSRYIFDYQQSYSNTQPFIRYSPKLKYRLVFETTGNLNLYLNTNDSVIWSSNTDGNPRSRLSIDQDGDVSMFNESNRRVWNTGTGMANSKVKTILAVDDNGYLVVYKQNNSLWDVAWIRPSIQTQPYYVLDAGVGDTIEKDKPFYFNSGCVTSELNTYHSTALLDRQLSYCKIGGNMFMDSLNCSKFYDGAISNNSSATAHIKGVCSSDYKSLYDKNSPEQAALSVMCNSIDDKNSYMYWVYLFIVFIVFSLLCASGACIVAYSLYNKSRRSASKKFTISASNI